MLCPCKRGGKFDGIRRNDMLCAGITAFRILQEPKAAHRHCQVVVS